MQPYLVGVYLLSAPLRPQAGACPLCSLANVPGTGCALNMRLVTHGPPSSSGDRARAAFVRRGPGAWSPARCVFLAPVASEKIFMSKQG